MLSLKTPSLDWIGRLYQSDGADPSFVAILELVPADISDDQLAELIESDGRARAASGRPVDLERYLSALPNLAGRIVPLDAAIDVTFRSMYPDGGPTSEAVEVLVSRYPDLAGEIRGAAMLGEAMWSTSTLRARATPLPKSLPPDVGPVVRAGAHRYQIQRLLGSGGWGTVYLAADRQLSEPDHPALVALKLFDSAGADLWVRRRMAEEATKARRVVHENVVRVLDLGVSDRDQDYIVYEYIDGGDLRAWAGQRTLPLEQRRAALLVSKIARGVQAAHSAGLVHCDLKPGNILITSAEEPKVADFGIAVREGEREQPWERGDSARPAGNLAFISPEQYRMEDGCLCIPSDVYALGGILYYLLTGKLPNGDNAEEIARTHDKETGRSQALSPRAGCPGIDRDMDLICRRALAVCAQDRHTSAGALADDLDAFLRREPIPWTRPTPLRSAALWARRRPGVAVASALTFLSVIAGTAAGTYWWSVASLRAKEAQHERAKIGAATVATQNIKKYFSLLGPNKFDKRMLPIAMAMEWINGAAFLGQPGDPSASWLQRKKVVRGLIDESILLGRADAVETLLWQGVLAFWLLENEDADQARSLLEQTIQTWKAAQRPDDPFVRELGLLAAAARVRQLAASEKTGDLNAQQKSELTELAGRFASEGEVFGGAAAGGPVHKLVLGAMHDLYGRKLLDRRADRDRVGKRIDSLKK